MAQFGRAVSHTLNNDQPMPTTCHSLATAHTALVAELIAAWNAHDVARILALYATDFVGHDVAAARPMLGTRLLRKHLERYMSAFPDVVVECNRVVAVEDAVAMTWQAKATHRGTFMRIPPTGRRVSMRGVTLLTIVGGKVTTSERIWDVAGLLRGMGLLTEL